MKRNIAEELSQFKFYGNFYHAAINGKTKVQIPVTSDVPNPKVYLITSDKKNKIKTNSIKGTTDNGMFIFEIADLDVFAIENKIESQKKHKEVSKKPEDHDVTDETTDANCLAEPEIINGDKTIRISELSYEKAMTFAKLSKAEKLLKSIININNGAVEQIEKNCGKSKSKAEKEIGVEKQKITETLQYLEEVSIRNYEAESERENSLLQQASNMQAAFSFISAGLFVIAQIVFDGDNNSSLSTTHSFMGFAFITFWLIISLVLATLVQRRQIRKKGRPSTIQLVQKIYDSYELMVEPFQRHAFMILEYEEMYDELHKINNKRAQLVKHSMWFFYIAIAASFVVAILLAHQAGIFNDLVLDIAELKRIFG